ncbi:peptidase C13 family-domain-containing protein [Lactifluus subvellereus]|nr:peptidase C13 family-domain-containing protein [Lactifluus subvellereus]
MRLYTFPLAPIFFFLRFIFANTETVEEVAVHDFFYRNATAVASESAHTNNWAVLVCASRYWFNYRHMANALGMYRTVKRLGIPDSNIILMLADDAACNSRNHFPGCVFANRGHALDLYGENIEVDYRGYEVTVENFIRLLTGRVEPSVPRSKRLLTDDRSNIFVYMTGHGGDEFLKFQDSEEISAFDIADAFEQMWQKKRYNEIFFMIDTCQANTMFSKFYSPNILATGSSQIRENSYSYENDDEVGVSVIDSYTHFILEYLEGINKTSTTSMKDLFDKYDPEIIRSHPGVRSDLFYRPLERTLITDFFGGVAHAEVMTADPTEGHNLAPSSPLGSPFAEIDSMDESPEDEHEVVEVLLDHADGTGDSLTRLLRAWGSVGIMGLLIAWAMFNTKQ